MQNNTFLIALVLDRPGRPLSCFDFRPRILNFSLLTVSSNGLLRVTGSTFFRFCLLCSTFADFFIFPISLQLLEENSVSRLAHMKLAAIMCWPLYENESLPNRGISIGSPHWIFSEESKIKMASSQQMLSNGRKLKCH